jgi:hypothetical protein
MDHEQQFAEAQEKIADLERRKQSIEAEIDAWRMIRDGFRKLYSKPIASVESSTGPLDAIRTILAEHPDGLSPMQIREKLVAHGITVGTGKYLMAHIHTLIKRDKKHIEMVARGGAKFYRLRDGVSD